MKNLFKTLTLAVALTATTLVATNDLPVVPAVIAGSIAELFRINHFFRMVADRRALAVQDLENLQENLQLIDDLIAAGNAARNRWEAINEGIQQQAIHAQIQPAHQE